MALHASAVAPIIGFLALAGLIDAAVDKKAAAAPAQLPPAQQQPPTALPPQPTAPTGVQVPSIPQLPAGWTMPQLPGAQPTATPASTSTPTVQVTDVQQRVANAIQSGNTQTMRQTASQLQAEGHPQEAQQLLTYATAVDTSQAVVSQAVSTLNNAMAQPATYKPPAAETTPTPAPATTTAQPVLVSTQVPAPPAAPPAAQPATTTFPGTSIQLPGMTGPITLPPVTIQQASPGGPPIVTGGPTWPVTDPAKVTQANSMNAMLAAKKPYTENTAMVKSFQTTEKLTADGLYGPGTAETLADRYGIIPTKPYYWSKTTSKVPAQKAEYTQHMLNLATRDPTRADQWSAASAIAGEVVDTVGAEVIGAALDEAFDAEDTLVIGLEYPDGTVIGWFGSKLVKKVGKAVKTITKSPLVNPAKAVTAVAKAVHAPKALVKLTQAKVLDPFKAPGAVLKAAKPILKSPITKAVAGGIAVAFPAVGVPAVAALAVANKVLDAAKGKLPDQVAALGKLAATVAKQKAGIAASIPSEAKIALDLKKAATKAIDNTYKQAKRGDDEAKRGLAALIAARDLAKKAPASVASIPKGAAIVPGEVYAGILVARGSGQKVGRWSKHVGIASQGEAHAGTLVLPTGMVVWGDRFEARI